MLIVADTLTCVVVEMLKIIKTRAQVHVATTLTTGYKIILTAETESSPDMTRAPQLRPRHSACPTFQF